ncbi:21852_t:CDS:2, partial [Racocetra persica]
NNPMPSNGLQAINASQRSQKECRVYVGNLAYEVKWAQLKDFMRQAGEVVFADVLVQPNGMSKGCGVVEYRTPEDARRAIETLNDTQLLGRPVFIREDRETEAKFGTGLSIRPDRSLPVHNSNNSHHVANVGGGNAGRQIYVGNLPYSVGWQELKDLFRNAGNIIRADILIGQDRRSKGSGTVLFETPGDAANAI